MAYGEGNYGEGVYGVGSGQVVVVIPQSSIETTQTWGDLLREVKAPVDPGVSVASDRWAQG